MPALGFGARRSPRLRQAASTGTISSGPSARFELTRGSTRCQASRPSGGARISAAAPWPASPSQSGQSSGSTTTGTRSCRAVSPPLGRAGDDGAGRQSVRPPFLPQPGERDGRTVGAVDVPGQPCCRRRPSSTRRSPTAGTRQRLLRDGGAEGGLLRHCLGARVDQQRAVVLVLVPARDQTPAHRHEPPLAGDHVDHVGGANVVIRHRRQVVGRHRREKLRHGVWRQRDGETSTHGH